MGNTYTVEVWHKDEALGYRYDDYYRGESLLVAGWMMLKAKRDGYKCVKFEWR